MPQIICQTIDLSKHYKDTIALDGVNLRIHKGDILGLIGENGAGKTTLIKLLAGTIFPSKGNIEFFGIQTAKEINKLRGKIGYMIETPAIYGDMTARQNLEVCRLQKGISNKESVINTLTLVNLKDDNKEVKKFSLGMKQRLALAIALIGKPDLLILDEPVNGLDPTGMVTLRKMLTKLNQEHGVTIIISSHILSELHKLATCYGFIHEGKLVEQITASELEKKTDDIETYFANIVGGDFID